MRYLGQRKGAVLIVVLGVLAVLALLGVTFATLQATERQVARNYLDTVRAKLAAQSGVQAAEAQLREYFPNRYFEGLGMATPLPKPWRFWGDDPGGAENKEPLPDFKLEDATNPSFAVEDEVKQDPLDPNKKPKLITINGRRLGYSGTHGGGFYGRGSEHYVLKINDISGRIYVNDGVDTDPSAGANTSVSQNLKRILNALGDQITVPQLGNKIIEGRPPGGYRHMNDLLKAVAYDEAIFARFRDYVTVNAWVDTNVVNPVPLSAAYATMFEGSTGVRYYRGNPAIYRHGSQIQGVDAANQQIQLAGGQGLMTNPRNTLDPDANETKIYGLDVLNPQWIEVVARAPVNVNAASKPVLVALLADLQGFFVGGRRRNNPRWKGDLYLSFKQNNKLRPESSGVSTTGDEYGWLKDTVPIVAKTGTVSADEISAFDIAEHIIACRERRNIAGFNYSNPSHWWTGPFRSWHQFNAFVDNLAKPAGGADGGAGILIDRRAGIHHDYEEESDSPSGDGKLVPSIPQAEHATKALADVLKANFNPNCHLNEMNPDDNLYLRVDKTDLFVNSTEFCFMPTGYFEVESLGRVVRPMDEKVTDVTIGANKLVSQAKVKAIYKLYEMLRETTQKHFYAGTLAPRGASWDTNNNMSLEVGPEPDNGEFPGNLGKAGEPDNEFGGYLALPTVGGLGVTHPKNTLMTTKQAGLQASMPPGLLLYVPFTLDQDAGFHVFGAGAEIASEKLPNETVENYADIVDGAPWPKGGPYNPTDGSPSQPIRMARSFRQTKQATGTTTMPSLTAFPPSDLRIDGTYVERHAAPAYYAHGARHFWQFDSEHANGQVAMWWKPSYYPDLTGKVRTIWDMSRYHTPCKQNVHVWPWATYFFPSNYDINQSETMGPKYWHNNCGQFEPSSLCFGSKQWHQSDADNTWLPGAHEFGHLTRSLNHVAHDPKVCNGKPSPLRGHRWMHTAMAWDLKANDSAGASSRLWINGSPQFSSWTYISMTGGWAMGADRMRFFDKHDGDEYNHMRFGATSAIADAAKVPEAGYRGNHTGDQTIDEAYVWKTMDEQGQMAIWLRGRYYKPDGGNYGEGFFTSAALELDKASVTRVLPMPGSAVPPGGLPPTSAVQPIDRRIRILGVAWTWYGEAKDPTVAEDPLDAHLQVLYSYNDRGEPFRNIKPRIGVAIIDGTNPPAGPYYDDTYSAVYEPSANGQPTGASLSIQDPSKVKYRVNFDIPAQFADILLATPVLDDVTIFYDDNQSHLLSFVFDNRSF